MPLLKIGGVILIILGLATAIFAKRIFEHYQKSDHGRAMQLERWPRMLATYIWLMRIGGIVGVLCGLIVVVYS